MKSGLVPIMDNSAPKYPRPIKTLERIPNRREQDYFYSYKNAEFAKIPWYQQLFNFLSQRLYFMTGPKFVVPILGIVQQKRNSKNLTKKYPDVKFEKRNMTSFLIYGNESFEDFGILLASGSQGMRTV